LLFVEFQKVADAFTKVIKYISSSKVQSGRHRSTISLNTMNFSFNKLFLPLALLSSAISSVSAKKLFEMPGLEEEDTLAKIVGGEPVDSGTYPWFTMLLVVTNNGSFERRQACGGMLVAPEWVLTANHCIDDDMRYRGAVGIGAFSYPYVQGNNGGQDVEFYTLQEVVEHPDYSSSTKDFDFSLLRLDGKSDIAPVPLDSTGLSETYSTSKDDLWAIGNIYVHIQHLIIQYNRIFIGLSLLMNQSFFALLAPLK